MNWANILRGILPEKLVEINPEILTSLEEIKLLSDNTSNKQTIYNDGTLIIINGGQNNEASKIISQLDVKKLDTGDTILEASTAGLLQQVEDNFWTDTVQKRIALYDSMIPSKDYHILEAAIFIQYLYDQGTKVDSYMRDVAMRYGQRGSMICHLYSAGYFDTLILPAYKESALASPPRLDEYNDVYELIVTESPLALFVSRRDKTEGIIEKLAKKIAINQSSGVNYINIHGIGEENKRNILRALQDESISMALVGEPQIQTKNSMTTVTIFLALPN